MGDFWSYGWTLRWRGQGWTNNSWGLRAIVDHALWHDVALLVWLGGLIRWGASNVTDDPWYDRGAYMQKKIPWFGWSYLWCDGGTSAMMGHFWCESFKTKILRFTLLYFHISITVATPNNNDWWHCQRKLKAKMNLWNNHRRIVGWLWCYLGNTKMMIKSQSPLTLPIV